ncbi:SPFH domain-containing protein [Streptomyces sp. NPDC012623]|uniref:SPFH domain-containing protein n=1 Tax=unclassified Streptomyces TaxID=2593676 RepID=UPI003678FC81
MTTTNPRPDDDGPDLRGVFAVRPEPFPGAVAGAAPGEDGPAPETGPQERAVERSSGPGAVAGAAEEAAGADGTGVTGRTGPASDAWDPYGAADTEPRMEPVAAPIPERGPGPGPDPALDPEPPFHSESAFEPEPALGPAPEPAPAPVRRSEPTPGSEPAPAFDAAVGPAGHAALDPAPATHDADTGPLAPWDLPVPLTLGAVSGPGNGSGNGLSPGPTSAPAPRTGGAPTGAAPTDTARPPRWSPLIVGESTHEIPVHLLFRDEPGRPPAPMPTVIGRRWGSGEQPRVRERPPVPAPVVPARAPAPGDPKLAERPGPVLPGWAALLAGGVALLACAALAWWCGVVPDAVTGALRLPSRPYRGVGVEAWALLAVGAMVALLAFGGLGRGRVGHAWVLTLFGDYRGSVRRTGLLWMSPLLLRRGVDVRLRHWRSEPMPAVDSHGTALRVVVLVVWRVRDTVRAALGVRDHEEYLREQVEAAMARVLSQLPADAFHDEAPTLRDAEAVGDALTRMLSAECRAVGVDVFSAQPTRIEYAPEIAAAIQRRRIAAIDAKHRDSVLTSVVDAVDDTVGRLTSRGLVELDDYERKALVKDLTVAFYTGRQDAGARW